MFRFFVLHCAAVLMLATFCFGERMTIVEAGMNGKEGPDVVDNLVFCPKSFSSNGFSIVCKELEGPVDFIVNGKRVKMENYMPYAIAGDEFAGRNIVPWTTYPIFAIITCVPQQGRMVRATVHFVCSTPAPAPAPAPDPTNSNVGRAPVLPLYTPGQKRRPSPLHSKPNIFSAPSIDPVAEDLWRKKCIVIHGAKFVNDLPDGWTVEGTSVTFRKNDNYWGVYPKTAAVLEYHFKPPAAATYAITVDMTTRNTDTWNDIWIGFGRGLNLRAGKKVITAYKGFVKVFHNQFGRAVEALGVNYDQYSLSTTEKLKSFGHEYLIEVGGRSPRVTVHRIIMFPCSGSECQYKSKVWKDGVKRCHESAG